MQATYWRLLCLGIMVYSGACESSSHTDPTPWTPTAGAGDKAEDASVDEPSDGSKPAVPEGCPVTPPTTCPSDIPHYADVQPIFAERCVTCHDGLHGQWPLNDYEPIADWAGDVRALLVNCTMPPVDSGLTMPVEERLAILTWIRCGFPK